MVPRSEPGAPGEAGEPGDSRAAPGASSGIDLVDVERLRRSLERSPGAFEARVFTAAERTRAAASPDQVRHFAALFAAKEACFKAIGLPYDAGFEWLHVDVDPGHCRRAATVRCSGAVAEHLGSDRLLLAIAPGRRRVIALAVRVPAASHRAAAC